MQDLFQKYLSAFGGIELRDPASYARVTGQEVRETRV